MNTTIKELGKKLVGLIPDKLWISIRFKQRTGYKMDWKNPRTFNQKLQWLKMYDRKPIYTTMVDKYEVKKYVANIVGEEYVVPTLGVWDSFDEIDFDQLPEQFVLKCTHDSGGLIIVKDKSKLDTEEARKKFATALKRNPYSVSREWPYKNVKPRIIAEQYVQSHQNTELKDCKFFCFQGVPKIMYVANEYGEDRRTDFFDMDYNHLQLRTKDPNAEVPPSKPEKFEEMKRLASILSQGMPHLRIDFYYLDEKIYMGEITFYHNGGFSKFEPKEWDNKMGDWLVLPIDQ